MTGAATPAMTRARQRVPALLLLAGMLLVAGGYLYLTLALPTPALADPLGPQIFPMLVCAGLFLSALLLVLELWRSSATLQASEPFDRRALALLVGITVWTGLYFFAFERAGFLLSTVVFLFGLMTVFNPGRWGVNAACATGFALGAWLLFVAVLSVRLPQGILSF